MSLRGNRPPSRTASTSHRRTSIPTSSAPGEPYIIPPPNGEDPDPGNDPPCNWDDSSEDEADAAPDNMVLPRLPMSTQNTRQSWCSSSRSKWFIGTYPRNPATTSLSQIEVQPNQIRTTRSNESIRSLGGIIRRATAAAQPRTTSEVKAAQGDSLRCSHDNKTSFIPDWEADTINIPEDYFQQVDNDEEQQNYTPYILPTSPAVSTENIRKKERSNWKMRVPFRNERVFRTDETLEKPWEAPLLRNASPHTTSCTGKRTPFIPPGDIIGHNNDEDKKSWRRTRFNPFAPARLDTGRLRATVAAMRVGTLATVPETPLDIGFGRLHDSIMLSQNLDSTTIVIPQQLGNGELSPGHEPPEIRPTDSVIWIESLNDYENGLSDDEDDHSGRYGPPSGNPNDPDNYGSPDRGLPGGPPEIRPTDSVIWIESLRDYEDGLSDNEDDHGGHYGPPSGNPNDPDDNGSPDHGPPGGPPGVPFGNPDQGIPRHPGGPHPAPGDEGPPGGGPTKGLQLPQNFQRGSQSPQAQALPINYGFKFERNIKISNTPQGDGNGDSILEELDGLNHVAYRNQSIYDNLSQITPRRLTDATQRWFHMPESLMQEHDQQSYGNLKMATKTYLINQQWFDKMKTRVLRMCYHWKSHELGIPSDCFHHRFQMIQELFVQISSGTIMETGNVAPQYWRVLAGASRINAIANLQKHIKYHKKGFMRSSDTQTQDLERRPNALEGRPANWSAELARTYEAETETDLTKKRPLRSKFTGSHAQLSDDKFPKNDQMVSIGETPQDRGARARQYCGSPNHEDFDHPFNGTDNQTAKAFLSALYTGALGAFAAYEKCRFDGRCSDKDDAMASISAIEEETDPQDFPEGGFSLLSNADQDPLDPSSPREEINPGKALESYFGRTDNENRKICDKRSLNDLILKNYCLAKDKQTNSATLELSSDNQATFITYSSLLKNTEKTNQISKTFDKLSLHDGKLQEGMHKLLDFTSHEWREMDNSFKRRAHLPIGVTPGLRGKSKRRIHWHPGIAILVGSSCRILLGLISTNFPASDLGLREGPQFSEQPLSYCLINKEWRNPGMIIVARNQGRQFPTRIAATLVPQMATLVIDPAGIYGAEIDSGKFLRVTFRVKLPPKATPGSAAYDLYTLDDRSILSHSQLLIPAGPSFMILSYSYGRITSGSGLSGKNLLKVTNGVTNGDYRETPKASSHYHYGSLFQATPEQTMVQILFLLLRQPLVTRARCSSKTSGGPDGFGSTNIKTIACGAVKFQPVARGAPAATFLGAHPSQTAIRLNTPDGPNAKVVTRLGYINSSVSSKPLEQLRPPPRPGEGRLIKNDQIIGHSSSMHYFPRDLRLGTAREFVYMRLEAYIVGNMSAPLILGNDCADRCSLSIAWEDNTASIQRSTPGNFLLLESSVNHPCLHIQALRARAQTIQHRRNNRNRNQWNRPSEMVIKHSKAIPPWTIEGLEFRPARPIKSTPAITPYYRQAGVISSSTLIDSIISPTIRCCRVTSDTNTPIRALPSGVIGIVKPDQCYDTGPLERAFRVRNFFTIVTPILQDQKDEYNSSEERLYQDPQADLPPSESELAKALGHEAVYPMELPSPLNFNAQLLTQRKGQLGEVTPRNRGSSSLDGRIGECSDIKYRIDFREESVPISIPTCHTPSETRADVDGQIDKWFPQRDFRESDGLRGALVIIVYRKGKWRVRIDYQGVNAVSLTDEYLLPKRTDILQALTGTQWFSISSALSELHRLGIIEERHYITAFRTHRHGLLEITRLPFGRHNSLAVFRRVMNKIQAGLLWLFALAYNQPHSDPPPNNQRLDLVLGTAAQAGITPSPLKFHIGYQSLLPFGRRVSCLENSTRKEEIDAIDTMEPPTKIEELRMFLGFTGCFASRVLFHTRVARPLYDLFSKDAPWIWNPLHQEAPGLCKPDLSSVLGFPQDAKGYCLRTESSNFGISAILRQTQPTRADDLHGTQHSNWLPNLHRSDDPPPQLVIIANKDERRPKTKAWNDEFDETETSIEKVIAYWSRLLNSAGKNRSPTEKETVVLRDALAMVQHLIEVEAIAATTNVCSAYPTFWVEHRAGRVHSSVNPLFRLERRVPFYGQPASNGPVIDISREKNIRFYCRIKRKSDTRATSLFAQMDRPSSIAIEVSLLDSHALASLTYRASANMGTHLHIDLRNNQAVFKGYEKHSYIKGVTESFPTKPPPAFKNHHHDSHSLIFFNGRLGRGRLCPPSSVRPKIMEGTHGSATGAAHAGFERTDGRTANGFFWPGTAGDIWQFVAKCPICKKIKHTGPIPCRLLRRIPIPSQPVEVVMMVFMEELPKSQNYDSTFVLIYKLTKYASFIACSATLMEKETAQWFSDRIVTYVGLPKQIVPDRDTRSRSDFWNDTEVPDRTITVAIRALTNHDGNDRSDHLPCQTVTCDKSPLAATGFAPSCLLRRFRPRTPFNLLTQDSSIVQTGEHGFSTPSTQGFTEEVTFVRLAAKSALQPRLEESHNENPMLMLCRSGDRVLICIHSLRLPKSKGTGARFTRSGPVTRRIGLSHSYGIHAVLKIAPLEPYQLDPSQNRPDLELLREDPEEFEVEEIMDQREERHRKNHRLIHQCRWKHYTRIVLLNAKEVLEAWKHRLKERYLPV